MRIGIDIDDTITKTKELVRQLKKEQYLDYNPDDLLPENLFQEFIIRNDDYIHQNVNLKEGALEGINYLKEKGHEIIFVTARGNYSERSEQDTKEYFKKYGIPYDKIVFNCQDKGAVCKEHAVDFFIDDNLKMCKQVYDQDINVIKMKREDEESPFIEFDNWHDIIKYIEEI